MYIVVLSIFLLPFGSFVYPDTEDARAWVALLTFYSLLGVSH